MSLNFKSNVALKLKKLKEIVGGAKLSLDFRDGEYLLNNTPIDLASAITTTLTGGGTQPGYYDADGNYFTASNVGAIISIDQTTFKKGLLLESNPSNLFLNTANPITREISINPSVRPGLYILAVFGSGKATLYIDNVKIGESVEGVPCWYIVPVSPAGARIARIEIEGSLSHVHFGGATQPTEPITRAISPTTTAGKRSAILNEINQNVLQQLYSLNQELCFVIKTSMPNYLVDPAKIGSTTNAVAHIKPNSADNVYVARQDSIKRSLVRIVNSNITVLSTAKPSRNTETYAVNFSKELIKMACGGEVGANTPVNFIVDALQIYVGCASSYATNCTQYIEQILVFDRNLTDEELQLITL